MPAKQARKDAQIKKEPMSIASPTGHWDYSNHRMRDNMFYYINVVQIRFTSLNRPWIDENPKNDVSNSQFVFGFF